MWKEFSVNIFKGIFMHYAFGAFGLFGGKLHVAREEKREIK